MKTNVALVILLCFCHVRFSHQQKPERCAKAPESGPCLARIPRLYYDSATNVCKEFFYGGCQGNDNNFESLEDCHRECTEGGGGQGNITGDRCAQRPEQGECKALLERYHYDTDSNSCKLFTYGGCGGNQNNFETEEQCQSACVKSSGKDGNRCSLKPEVGVCRARIPRLYYDPESNKCKEFFYGGCGGNANNFETVEECDTACVSMSRADRCYAEMVQGPCKSNLRRLYFDRQSNTCKEFTYGGCGGNENNFETYEACSSACIKTSTGDKCSQSADRGNCRAMVLRYYYNSTFQECVEFVYGGCGGNENNFESQAECVDECGNSAPALAFTSFVIITITSLALIIITTQW